MDFGSAVACRLAGFWVVWIEGNGVGLQISQRNTDLLSLPREVFSKSFMTASFHILLVHPDDSISAGLIRRMRKLVGFELHCEHARKLPEALRYLRGNRLDLILVDHGLMAVDNFEFMDRLDQVSEPPGVIVIDAVADSERTIEVLDRGALDYLGLDGLTDAALGRSLQHAVHRHQTAQRLHHEVLVKNRFITIISHDIRSPLVILSETLSCLLQRFDVMSKPQMRNFLEKAQRRSQSLVQMTENLLTWSSLQSGKMSPDWVETELRGVVDEAIEQAHSQAEAKGVILCNEVANSSTLATDGKMLSCVLRNLLTNAIKFSFNGQSVFVRATCSPEECQVMVKDHGMGIQPEDMDKLFQADELFTRRGTQSEEGSGMGLLLCHEFVKALGGRIEVSSEPGSGATFTLVLPNRRCF